MGKHSKPDLHSRLYAVTRPATPALAVRRHLLHLLPLVLSGREENYLADINSRQMSDEELRQYRLTSLNDPRPSPTSPRGLAY